MTDYSKKCARIDARFHRAGQLVSMWSCGNREYVVRELGIGEGKVSTRKAARLIAAIGCMARPDVGVPFQQKMAGEILEAVARERF